MSKKVVFVCLLSLSLCLSQPTVKTEASDVHQVPDVKATEVTEKSAVNNASVTSTAATHAADVTPQAQAGPVTPAKDTKENAGKIDNKVPAQNKVEPAKKEDGKSTESTPAAATTQHEETKAGGKNTSSSTAAPAADTRGDTPATTRGPAPSAGPAPTAAPAPREVTDAPLVQARGFDGASFVGGIILTLGLLAIGFMGFKYYKNQTERNYHTL